MIEPFADANCSANSRVNAKTRFWPSGSFPNAMPRTTETPAIVPQISFNPETPRPRPIVIREAVSEGIPNRGAYAAAIA